MGDGAATATGADARGARQHRRDSRARLVSRRSLGRVRDASESRRTVLIALGANAFIAVAKLGGGLLSGSAAMLAEAAHSLADTTNQAFLRISLSRAERGSDERHPFGYGQERFFWAFLAAVFIFVAGALFSVGQGLERLLAPSE